MSYHKSYINRLALKTREMEIYEMNMYFITFDNLFNNSQTESVKICLLKLSLEGREGTKLR